MHACLQLRRAPIVRRRASGSSSLQFVTESHRKVRYYSHSLFVLQSTRTLRKRDDCYGVQTLALSVVHWWPACLASASRHCDCPRLDLDWTFLLQLTLHILHAHPFARGWCFLNSALGFPLLPLRCIPPETKERFISSFLAQLSSRLQRLPYVPPIFASTVDIAATIEWTTPPSLSVAARHVRLSDLQVSLTSWSMDSEWPLEHFLCRHILL